MKAKERSYSLEEFAAENFFNEVISKPNSESSFKAEMGPCVG
jgi:hypothetical protein